MFLFYLGFILSILGLISLSFKTFKSKNLISPQIILFLGVLMFLYLPAISNNYIVDDYVYNGALFAGVVGSLMASFKYPVNILDSEDNEKPIKTPKSNLFKYGAIIFAGWLIFEIGETIMQHGSIIGVFVSNRLEGYLGENLESGNSPFRRLFFEGLKILFYFYLNMIYVQGKKKRFFMLMIIPLIHHVFTAVTRFDMLAMLGAMVIFVINHKMYKNNESFITDKKIKKTINPKKIIILSIIGMYCALLFMRVANQTRHGITDGSMLFDYAELLEETFKDDSNYYQFFYDEYVALQNGSMHYEYGKAWYYYPFVNFIPRSFWNNKPYTSFSVRGTEAVYYSYTSGNPVVTFTVFGEGYGQLGILGCLLCPFVFLGGRFVNFRQAKRIEYNQLYLLILFFSLFTFARAEAPIFYVLIDYVWFKVIERFCTKKVV